MRRTVTAVTCLGCGCACDDLEVVVDAGHVAEARRACALGLRWFEDASVRRPAALLSGRPATVDEVLGSAAQLLNASASPLVYLAPELTCEAQREAVALADVLGSALDTVSSGAPLRGLLAAQEHGRVSATLGEIRNRADVLLFWGIDPGDSYPRFWSRYAPDPAGRDVPDGRRSRRIVAVDIGDRRGPADADVRIAVAPRDEAATLGLAVALLKTGPAEAGPYARTGDRAAARRTWGPALAGSESRPDAQTTGPAEAGPYVPSGDRAAATQTWGPASAGSSPRSREQASWGPASAGPEADLAQVAASGRYVAVIADGETDTTVSAASALVNFVSALNDVTRAALCTLRAGGNRSGADAVLTWQTGFPTAIDFARGFPEYRPHDGTALTRLARNQVDAALVIGAPGRIPAELRAGLLRVPCVIIGPLAGAAGESAWAAIDTGVAGVHEGGLAYRMDDVPVRLQALLEGPPLVPALLRDLRQRCTPR